MHRGHYNIGRFIFSPFQIIPNTEFAFFHHCSTYLGLTTLSLSHPLWTKTFPPLNHSKFRPYSLIVEARNFHPRAEALWGLKQPKSFQLAIKLRILCVQSWCMPPSHSYKHIFVQRLMSCIWICSACFPSHKAQGSPSRQNFTYRIPNEKPSARANSQRQHFPLPEVHGSSHGSVEAVEEKQASREVPSQGREGATLRSENTTHPLEQLATSFPGNHKIKVSQPPG